jgi:hypothetical protein
MLGKVGEGCTKQSAHLCVETRDGIWSGCWRLVTSLAALWVGGNCIFDASKKINRIDFRDKARGRNRSLIFEQSSFLRKEVTSSAQIF